MLGGLIVIGGIVVMVMIHEAGHFVAAKAFGMKATEFFFGFGPKLWSIRRGETEYGVKALPFGGYVRVIGMNPLEEVPAEEEPRTYRGAKFWKKSVVVLAGVGSNFLIALVLLWVVAVFVGEPDPDRPVPEVAAIVSETEDRITGEMITTAAVKAGIEPGDLLVEVDGTRIGEWDDLTGVLRASPNETVEIVVERNGELLTLSATLTERVDTETGEVTGFLGVAPRYELERLGPVQGLGAAFAQAGVLVRESAKGIWALVTGLGDLVASVFEGEEVSDEVRPLSPIGIARLGAASQQVGLDLTLTIVAWINIFVGLLNVLPIYPLDGGHFSVALYEKVTGREADVRKLIPVAAAVVIFLVLLGVIGIYLDIVSPVNLG